ncbi:MAG TPA: hypothetical protein VL131_10335 [Gammaproteobacteria bacterium]|nr:hypothetical protein [Gammaproteobacteria bacterium]
MKAFIDWVLAQRLRPIVLAVVAAPLLTPVSSALIALETVRRDFAGGVICALGTLAGLLAITTLAGVDTSVFAVGAVCVVSGVVIGLLIRRAGNLALAFQTTVLVGMVLVTAIGLLGFDTRVLFEATMQDLIALLEADEASKAYVEFIQERGAALAFSAVVFVQLVGTLMLAYWWSQIAMRQRGFGQEFRNLALGRVLGVVATLVIVLGLASGVELVQNLLPLAGFGFLLQGVAVVHAWAHAKRWPPGLVAPLYVLLLLPAVNVLVAVPLGVVGVVDNWFDLRSLIRSQA